MLATIGIAIIPIVVLTYFLVRSLRIRGYEPRFIPTEYLKQRWRNWSPYSSRYGQIPGGRSTQQTQTVNRTDDTAYAGAGAAEEAQVGRNVSVRSVMTLPAYSPVPKASEQIIGREGERGDMDVVIEFPETAEDEEMRREEEMESLYQIRQARRREIEEREERRRQRREARERGDLARLQQLRQESNRARAESQLTNDSSTNLSAATLLAEHQSRGRDRRISSVSYADVGHVRHDGTRLRSSSQESDSRPLLDTAAAMGQDGSGPLGAHQRNTSGTSLVSQSSVGSGPSQRGASISHAPETDIGESGIPPPPEYEQLEWGDAPPYPETRNTESTAAPQLPPITNLPSIAIENATPPPSAPVTPICSQPEAPPPSTSAPR